MRETLRQQASSSSSSSSCCMTRTVIAHTTTTTATTTPVARAVQRTIPPPPPATLAVKPESTNMGTGLECLRLAIDSASPSTNGANMRSDPGISRPLPPKRMPGDEIRAHRGDAHAPLSLRRRGCCSSPSSSPPATARLFRTPVTPRNTREACGDGRQPDRAGLAPAHPPTPSNRPTTPKGLDNAVPWIVANEQICTYPLLFAIKSTSWVKPRSSPARG